MEDKHDAALLGLVFYRFVLLRDVLTWVGWLDSEEPRKVSKRTTLLYFGWINGTSYSHFYDSTPHQIGHKHHSSLIRLR